MTPLPQNVRHRTEIAVDKYARTFRDNEYGKSVYSDLLNLFGNVDGYIPDALGGARLELFLAGQRSVVRFITAAIEQAEKGQKLYVDSKIPHPYEIPDAGAGNGTVGGSGQ
jgi:hypothetical protein